MEVIIIVGLIIAFYYLETSIIPNNRRIKKIEKELDALNKTKNL